MFSFGWVLVLCSRVFVFCFCVVFVRLFSRLCSPSPRSNSDVWNDSESAKERKRLMLRISDFLPLSLPYAQDTRLQSMCVCVSVLSGGEMHWNSKLVKYAIWIITSLPVLCGRYTHSVLECTARNLTLFNWRELLFMHVCSFNRNLSKTYWLLSYVACAPAFLFVCVIEIGNHSLHGYFKL